MFEKEAEEWVRTNSGYSTKEFHGQKAIKAFLAGAEFGYNKANEQLNKAKTLAAEMQEKEPDAGWEAMNGEDE